MNTCTYLATATLATSLHRGFLLEVLQRVEYKHTSGHHMWMLTVRCATSSWPKVREGDRKRKRSAGIPTVRAAKALPINSVLKNAPKSWRGSQPLHVARFLPPSASLSLPDLLRVVYHCIVDRPVETPCISGLVLEADLSVMQCLCCPESHNITSSCFPLASDVILKVMGAKDKTIRKCNKYI